VSFGVDSGYTGLCDNLGRMAGEQVLVWDASKSEWSSSVAGAEDRRVVHFGAMILLELDGTDSNAVLNKYIHGLGVDGRLGGPGSIVSMRDAAAAADQIYYHDGAGNLGQVVDRSDGSVVGKYGYDAPPGGKATFNYCLDRFETVDDCDLCGPCYRGYFVHGHHDTGHRLCGCGPDHGQPGNGCTTGECWRNWWEGYNDPDCAHLKCPPTWLARKHPAGHCYCTPHPHISEPLEPFTGPWPEVPPEPEPVIVVRGGRVPPKGPEGGEDPTPPDEPDPEPREPKHERVEKWVRHFWCGNHRDCGHDDKTVALAWVVMMCEYNVNRDSVAFELCVTDGMICVGKAGSKDDLCKCVLIAAGYVP